MSDSVAAVVHGFRDLDRRVPVAGVILNRVASDGHAAMCREALAPLGIPVLGAIRHDETIGWRERHLGLVPVAEHPDEVRSAVARFAAVIDSACDLERIVHIADAAPTSMVSPLPSATPSAKVKVALASGPAFSFVYPENLALLEQAGADLEPFDPISDRVFPDGCHALYAGGGFPEVFGAALADNRPLLESVRRSMDDGLVVWAECGGLLWLCRSLDGATMLGAVPADAQMTDTLTIGYRTAKTTVASPLGPPSSVLRGYEFHRTVVDPPGNALELEAHGGPASEGYASPDVFASYLHQHLSSAPAIAEQFVKSAAGAPLP